jgi:DNA polymerase elongation subunit (family B)
LDFYTNVRQYGKYILYRGVENGKKVARRVEYRPTFFVPSKKKSKYKTLDGHYVEPIQPGNINDARDFLERYSGVETFPIYGNNRYEYTFIADAHSDDVLWDAKYLTIAYIDIEVGSDNGFPEPREANEPVTAITILIDGKYTTFGCGDYTPHREDVTYIKCRDEIELLRKFLGHWSCNYPDIVTGWNVKFFDIPYLINRMLRVLDEGEANIISPWKKFREKNTMIKDREQQSYMVFGIAILDYMELYKKYSPVASQESYALNHIAGVELGRKKLDYSEYDSLYDLYKRDHQKFIEYNILDTELVYEIEVNGVKSSKLLELALTLAYDNKCNYEDVFQQVRMWDSIIFNHLKKKNIVIPMQKLGKKDDQYAGAHVKEPKPGLYNWVVSFDLNSLYPHLIMQYNLSPETLIKVDDYTDEMRAVRPSVSVDSLLNREPDLSFLKGTKVTVTPNQQFFYTGKRGFLGEIMDDMYKGRSRYKKMAIEAKKKLETVKEDPNQYAYVQREVARYNNLQMAKKVSLNSAYGAIGNQYFRFFDIRIAEAITLGGQLSYKWIESHINEYLNKLVGTTGVDYVIAGDTDSMYLNLEALVQKFIKNTSDKHKVIDLLDKICEEKIQPFIDKTYQELADYTNAYEQKMQMKRESLCDRAIWKAKKHYILNVYDEEGVKYKEPKVKTVGIETNKTSAYPAATRAAMRECIKVILDKDEAAAIQYIEDFRVKFRTLPIEDIAFPRGVNGIEKNASESDMWIKGTPMHTKAAILYNHILREKKLTKRYQSIKDGEKIKFVHLKQPNPYRNNTIGFINRLPKEFELEEYIDYDEQFDGTFLEPMRGILSVIGWKAEEVSSLESFFT